MEVMLFCNSIKKKFLPIADLHGVHLKTYSKTKFILKSKKLKPALKIKSRRMKRAILPIYAKTVIRELRKKVSPGTQDRRVPEKWQNALLICNRSWNDRRDDFSCLNIKNLRDHPRAGRIISNLSLKTKIDYDKEFDVPEVYIINYNNGEKDTRDNIETMLMWLEVTYHFPKPEEIILGFRSSPDYYGYEDHIRDRIRKFEPLWRRYRVAPPNATEWIWDKTKIRDDLERLKDFRLILGFFPEFEEIKLLEDFAIEDGPGSLVRRWENIKSYWASRGEHESIKEVETNLNREVSQWLTVALKFSDQIGSFYFADAVKNLRNSHAICRRGDPWGRAGGGFLFGPRKLGQIPDSALQLSAKYFSHLALDEEEGASSET